ncbi:MAG: hypothetical protein M3P30_01505 [Chloroflexota bacterium]|nr:hypothetical protein [Chloroflexota bacterium]
MADLETEDPSYELFGNHTSSSAERLGLRPGGSGLGWFEAELADANERGITLPPLKVERARAEEQLHRLLHIAYSMADPDWDDRDRRDEGPVMAIRQPDVHGSPWLDFKLVDGEFQLRFRCAGWQARTGFSHPEVATDAREAA